MGAGRTGSVFAIAPFVGAAAGLALGDRGGGLITGLAAACFAVAVVLHATERHGHAHVHGAIDHEHAHTHDDGHHAHTHDTPVVGEHTHPHRHELSEHAHDHAPDVHHQHAHE